MTDNLPPLMCSQGGVPYNKAHLDARASEITRLQEALAAAEAERETVLTQAERFLSHHAGEIRTKALEDADNAIYALIEPDPSDMRDKHISEGLTLARDAIRSLLALQENSNERL